MPISPYLPMDRRQALATGESLPEYAHGAALFADISGFTPLTEALADAYGPQRGAEELSNHVNRVYTALIAEVHRYRGSVISFAGDAITCWFDEDKGPRGATCALAMQQRMREIAAIRIPGSESIPLEIKIAVLGGQARRFMVGNPQIQRFDILAGALLDRMADAAQQLHSGEVGLGTELLGWLGDQAQIGPWRPTPQGESFVLLAGLKQAAPADPWPDLPALSAELTQGWLLPSVRQRLERGEEMLLAELRTLTPCFLKFSGLDYDNDPQAPQKLDAFTHWVQTVLRRYDGYLSQIVIGDKGSSMYILFGAPAAHEDDAERAVGAALALREAPDGLRFVHSLQTGISQGRMYIGAYGSPARRTYAGLGNEVNLAARLMSQAQPGQILVSGHVALAAHAYTFEPLGEVELKGIGHPVPVYAASGLRRKPVGAYLHIHQHQVVTGRENERATLRQSLHNLQNGHSGACILEGEAGIGKSCLASDLHEQAQAIGVLTLIAAGESIEHDTAYYAWRPVFQSLFGLETLAVQSSSDTTQARVFTYLKGDPFLVERLPLLSPVLPFSLPDNELTAQMSGEVRADNTRQVLVHILQRAAGESGGLLLIIEDAQWLDSASWTLLTSVQQQVQPLLLLLATRPQLEDIPAAYSQLRQAEGVQHLALGALEQEDTQALACHRLGAQRLAPEVAALINERAEGNPFFSEELAAALKEAGLVFIDEAGVCRLAPHASAELRSVFPDTIQGVITSRIDHLPPAEQTTLKIASVIGRLFALRTLRDIHPLVSDHPQLEAYLLDLERLEITLRQGLPPELKYLFKHTLTQETAYNLLLFAQRRELHQRIAEWYEQNQAEDLSPYYSLLAYHWQQAENLSRAIDYLEKAGEQALKNYANQETIAFFSDALRLEKASGLQIDATRRARWLLHLGEACVSLSRYAESQEHFSAGLAALGRPLPQGNLQTGLRLPGQIGMQIAHRLFPARYIGRKANQYDLIQDVSHAYAKLGEAYLYLNNIAAILYAVFAALNESEDAGHGFELARNYTSVGALMGLIPIHRYAQAYIQRALKVAEESQEDVVKGYTALGCSYYFIGFGEWSKTEDLLNQAQEIYQRIGDSHSWETALGHLAIARHLQGDFSKCIELAEKVYRSANKRGDIFFEILALSVKLYSLPHSGNLEQTLATMQMMQDIQAAHPAVFDNTAKYNLYGLSLALYCEQEDYEKLLQNAQNFEEIFSKPPIITYGMQAVYSNLARARMVLWAREVGNKDLKKKAEAACKRLENFTRTFPIGKPAARLWRGVYLWQSGQQAAAQRAWGEAILLGEKMKMPYEQGLAHYEAGRHLKPGDPQRQQNLQKAVEIFRRLEAAPALKRAEEALPV